MAIGDVKLIGARPSPFVNRVQIALNLKSTDYEFLQETFGSKSELLLQSNPVHKKIPVLIHNDKPICESLVIVEYIDEISSSSPPLLPSDPYDRAIARFWAAYADDKIVKLIRELRTAKDEAEKLIIQKQFLDVSVTLEGAFIECSKGHDFFGGNKMGYLDLALGCYLGWIKATEKLSDVNLWDETKIPNLVQWGKKFLMADAVKDVMPGTEELVEFSHLVAKLAQASR